DNGSGVDAESVKLVVAGEDVTAQATRSPRFITYRPAHPLPNGPVMVRLSLKDRAGNPTEVEWQFTVDAPEVPITSVSHTASRPLTAGQSFTVTLAGKPGGAASFDIGNLKVGIPMQETAPGIYQGRYTAEKGDMVFNARIVGHLVTPAGEKFSRECSEPVSLVTLPPRAPVIVSPSDGEVIEPALVVTGRAQPGVMVRVQVTRMVRKLGLWSDRDVVAVQEANVDKEGVFTTAKMMIPTGGGQRKEVTIQAVAVDPAGQLSEVVSVKVKLP
ncbi:MAG: hypothetical protein QHJ73_18295, partial [Armatimonadota bacterium]|nr:hypothetical protein [Armatimonadota bacterium]